jgi:hypothetical protein
VVPDAALPVPAEGAAVDGSAASPSRPPRRRPISRARSWSRATLAAEETSAAEGEEPAVVRVGRFEPEGPEAASVRARRGLHRPAARSRCPSLSRATRSSCRAGRGGRGGGCGRSSRPTRASPRAPCRQRATGCGGAAGRRPRRAGPGRAGGGSGGRPVRRLSWRPSPPRRRTATDSAAGHATGREMPPPARGLRPRTRRTVRPLRTPPPPMRSRRAPGWWSRFVRS